jgi:hypothetical protein
LRLLRSRFGGIIRDIPARSPAKPSSRLERPLARRAALEDQGSVIGADVFKLY